MGGNRRVNAAHDNRKLSQSIHRLLAAERRLPARRASVSKNAGRSTLPDTVRHYATGRGCARTAQRSLADEARGLALSSSEDARVTSCATAE